MKLAQVRVDLLICSLLNKRLKFSNINCDTTMVTESLWLPIHFSGLKLGHHTLFLSRQLWGTLLVICKVLLSLVAALNWFVGFWKPWDPSSYVTLSSILSSYISIYLAYVLYCFYFLHWNASLAPLFLRPSSRILLFLHKSWDHVQAVTRLLIEMKPHSYAASIRNTKVIESSKVLSMQSAGPEVWGKVSLWAVLSGTCRSLTS